MKVKIYFRTLLKISRLSSSMRPVKIELIKLAMMWESKRLGHLRNIICV